MRRRDFIKLISGSTIARPVGAWAQQSNAPKRIGMLMGVTETEESHSWVSTFEKAIEELGWIEGRSAHFEIRWASADVEIMRAQASELVGQRCDVILTHATPATLALRSATTTIPNVFVTVADPVGSGFVKSVTRPGTNATGFTNFEETVGGKWLELLRAVAPRVQRVSLLLNPKTYPGGLGGVHVSYIQATASSFGMTAVVTPFDSTSDIETAFEIASHTQSIGMIVMPDSSTTSHSKEIPQLATRHGVPAAYPYRFFVVNGGLISYGTDISDLYRRSASYVDRILRGTTPDDLPVQAPTKYELVINLKGAKALGLTVPPTLLSLADQVIE
jgi:putative ABC transport system substrate-binding protein